MGQKLRFYGVQSYVRIELPMKSKKTNFVIFLSLLISFCAQAERVGQGTNSKGSKPQTSSAAEESAKLPYCFEGEGDLNEIFETQKMNSKNKFKYDGYKRVFRGEGPDSKGKSLVSEREVFARLVYAEALAAECKGGDSEAVKIIAEVISNRIEKRKGRVGDVIFERDQFASSLNRYSESKYKEFLCPKNLKMWEMADKKVLELLANPKSNSLPADTFNYYFFLHSTRFNAPKWTEAYQSAAVLNSESKKCLEAYKNPGWK